MSRWWRIPCQSHSPTQWASSSPSPWTPQTGSLKHKHPPSAEQQEVEKQLVLQVTHNCRTSVDSWPEAALADWWRSACSLSTSQPPPSSASQQRPSLWRSSRLCNNQHQLHEKQSKAKQKRNSRLLCGIGCWCNDDRRLYPDVVALIRVAIWRGQRRLIVHYRFVLVRTGRLFLISDVKLQQSTRRVYHLKQHKICRLQDYEIWEEMVKLAEQTVSCDALQMVA